MRGVVAGNTSSARVASVSGSVHNALPVKCRRAPNWGGKGSSVSLSGADADGGLTARLDAEVRAAPAEWRSSLAGIVASVFEVCERSGAGARVVFAVPPGPSAAATRAGIVAAVEGAGCVAHDLVSGADADAAWRSFGPAPTDEALATLPAGSADALVLVEAYRRSVNPYRAAVIASRAVKAGGLVLVAERLFAPSDGVAAGSDLWRTSHHGVSLLASANGASIESCSFTSSRNAVLDMAAEGRKCRPGMECKRFDDRLDAAGLNAHRPKGSFAGGKQLTSAGGVDFGSFVTASWAVARTPSQPPVAPPSSTWGADAVEARMHSALGPGGQGLASLRSRCKSFAPRANWDRLEHWVAEQTATEATGKSMQLPLRPAAIVRSSWFTRLGWHLNAMLLIQELAPCGNILFVSSHESQLPGAIKAAGCFRRGCMPKMHWADWPAIDVMDLDRDIRNGKLARSNYDLVVLDQVLEHVPLLLRAASGLRELLRPGGHVLIAMPAHNPVHFGPLDLWRAQLDGVLALGSAVGTVSACGTVSAPGVVGILASQYPNIYGLSSRTPAVMAAVNAEGDFVGQPRDGAMSATSWVLASLD